MPSAFNWEGFLLFLQLLETGSPRSRFSAGGGCFHPAVPPQCQPSQGKKAKLLLHDSCLLTLAAACGIRPKRNLFSVPWAHCLTRGFVKHGDTTCVLCFGPGGVKDQKKRGCCWRGRHWHFPACSPVRLASVCRHRALYRL